MLVNHSNNNGTAAAANDSSSATSISNSSISASNKQRQSSITSLFRSNSNNQEFNNAAKRTNSFNKKMNFNFKNPFKNNNAHSSSDNIVQPAQPVAVSGTGERKKSVPQLNLNTNVFNLSEEEEEEDEEEGDDEVDEEDEADEEEEEEEEEDGHEVNELTEEDDDYSSSSSSSVCSSVTSNNSQTYEEDEKDYCYGGYHPTFVGEIYGPKKNFKIVRKLGWGHFSTVWLAYDSITETHVAIKIVRSAKHYTEAAVDEIKILTTINNGNDTHPGKNHLVRLLDNFIIKGPNGEHVCMVFEVLGENTLNLIKKFKNFQKVNKIKDIYGGLPLPLVKHITRQLLLAIDYLHVECNLIHTDIKPENILIEIKNVEKLLKLIERQDRKSSKKRSTQKTPPQPKKPLLSKNKPPLHRSRKSVSKIAESPVRSSKPLQSPLSTEEILHRSSVVSTPILENKITALKIDEEDHLEVEEEEEEEYDSDEIISIKIADLGNACWTNLHYTDDIQTRQYRSPEIIMGADWGCSTDIWSLGCLIFELITSDYLFDPKNGPNYDKDDDHLAQIIELLSEWPSMEFLKNCEYASKFVSMSSHPMRLKRIKNLKIWELDNVLIEKYHLSIRNSFEISRFLKCFLRIEPWERMDCASLLRHEWLQNDSDNQELEEFNRGRKYATANGYTKGEYIRGWCSLVS